uniref:vomeronasal type-2 receptor 26-like n=1 Tax=Podarcis muralis TaxID=64176 RepID=UPI00109F5F3E|nr:vomeronasal type-2 receptor 26-like [Podarcis muralis]
MELLSTKGKFFPNYKCDVQDNLIAVIGGPNFDVDLNMAIMLWNYKIPQLPYGSALVVDCKDQGVFFHQMFPDVDHQYKGILQLLLHFRWTWIGVFYLDDDTGERFSQIVLLMFSQSGICFDFIEKFPKLSFSDDVPQMVENGIEKSKMIMNSTASVLIAHGEIQTMIVVRMLLFIPTFMDMPLNTKVWIMTAQMDFASLPFQSNWDIDFLQGAISFAVSSMELQTFHKFLHAINPTLEKEYDFIRVFWERAFSCLFPGPLVDNMGGRICTGREKLETLPASVFEMSMTGHSYSVYNAVYAVAHALHEIYLFDSKHRGRANKRSCTII